MSTKAQRLAQWPSLLGSDAFQIKPDETKKVKRTITIEEDGSIKPPEAIMEAITTESNKFYISTPQKKPDTPLPLRLTKSNPAPGIANSLKSLVKLGRPERYHEVNNNPLGCQLYVRRKSNISTVLEKQINYDDPELELKVSASGIVVMGGTKKKLIGLLTDLAFTGLYNLVS